MVMRLSDERIKALCPELITPFEEKKLSNICYDLSTKCFCVAQNDERIKIELQPGEAVFVESEEIIKLPNNLCAYVHLRNSRIRQGLALDAPVYQPGHETNIFFRVTNISKAIITLETTNGIASIYFDEVTEPVAHPYDGEFQSEFKYKGLGDYSSKLKPDIKEIDEKIDSIKNIERTVYTNVLSIMAIFVGIFTLINIDVTSAMQEANAKVFLTLNFTTVGSIGFLIAMINTILPDGKHKKEAWIACGIAFLLAIVIQFAMK